VAQSLRTAGKSATQRHRMQDDSPAKVEDLETDVPTDKLPTRRTRSFG
jgi:hypothetical protein